jgi:hypothetical protein
MEISNKELKNPMEDLNLWYHAVSFGNISGDVQNICNFVPINMVS